MFEKDIYQLIRGMRAHKGNEREYIQASLRECRKEVKGQDMDQKATALLKLIYLEMFGHDMSWASFNVLEVMSSPKYVQKRVGYLAAVQSFRADTEVLMLAENLLKKDLISPDKPTIALSLVTVPHIINPSMANSLLTDILPRLSHSSPAIRKKTVVTLYRIALVYPETLRPAWPKITERLLDEDEDSSVTAAIVNVICELGWRRPQDFLPLAPRLFDLLTTGGNNWMAIKIIKLFSVLTPLEPRLVRKLLPPLTSLIKTTPAMSLLYECINGIIQGGIMEAAEGTTEGDEIARLCLGKLRAMMGVEGDPNLRYVALLAFAKITSSHADLVSQHSDVILECIDDGDISIRTRALDLVVGMVNPSNLQSIVDRLVVQLKTSGKATAAADDPAADRSLHEGIIPMADDDDEDAQTTIKNTDTGGKEAVPLPDDYRISVIEKILHMCSKDTYANMDDFEWYISVLVELVEQCPVSKGHGDPGAHHSGPNTASNSIGDELLNVAVRVRAARPEAAAAAQALLQMDQQAFGQHGVLAPAAFIVGEYVDSVLDPDAVMANLLAAPTDRMSADTLISYLQAIPKVFARLSGSNLDSWTSSRKDAIQLLIARVSHFMENLTSHPNLEVQERAVEYLDLMRLASEAASSHSVSGHDEGYVEPPLLLTDAIPSLFRGMELNPVSRTALKQVPLPEDIDLDAPINQYLDKLLQEADQDSEFAGANKMISKFYYERQSKGGISKAARPAAELLQEAPAAERLGSYQDTDPISRAAIERSKAERRERYKDDPYYIDSERNSGTSTPMHQIIRTTNGQDLDVDQIPVMELKLGGSDTSNTLQSKASMQQLPKNPKRHFEIAADETLGGGTSPRTSSPASSAVAASKTKKSILQVDSSRLSSLSITGGGGNGARQTQLDIERQQAEEEEMAKAIREVERLRLEMQRKQELIGGVGEDYDQGTIVKRKKKKSSKASIERAGDNELASGKKPEKKSSKTKKIKARGDDAVLTRQDGQQTSVPQKQEDTISVEDDVVASASSKPKKKKKKRQVTFDQDT